MTREARMIQRLGTMLLVAAPLLAQGTGGANAPAQQKKPYVILISFDGMKPGYLDRIELPNFQRVMKSGVRSTGMIPTFPSKTFPNHYSIVTGRHAGRHGLVGNSFWDPSRNAGYRMADTLAVRDSSWYRGEPIWATAEKQGMVAASFFWPGSEAAIGGARPSLFKRYDGRVPNAARVDSVLGWLQLPEANRPHMITMYFSTVDGAGHEHGPLSPQVDSAAWAVDSALGRLMNGIEQLPFRDRVYLVLASDHGMSEQSPRWFVALDTLIDTTGVYAYDAGPNVNLHVRRWSGSGAAAARLDQPPHAPRPSVRARRASRPTALQLGPARWRCRRDHGRALHDRAVGSSAEGRDGDTRLGPGPGVHARHFRREGSRAPCGQDDRHVRERRAVPMARRDPGTAAGDGHRRTARSPRGPDQVSAVAARTRRPGPPR